MRHQNKGSRDVVCERRDQRASDSVDSHTDRERRKAEKSATKAAAKEAWARNRAALKAQDAAIKAARDAAQSELDARTGAVLHHAWGTQLFVFENEVWRGRPDEPASVGGSIVGASAEVLTQGQVTQRLTATRLAVLGVFALAAPKKSGNQRVYLRVSAPGFEFMYSPIGDARSLTV